MSSLQLTATVSSSGGRRGSESNFLGCNALCAGHLQQILGLVGREIIKNQHLSAIKDGQLCLLCPDKVITTTESKHFIMIYNTEADYYTKNSSKNMRSGVLISYLTFEGILTDSESIPACWGKSSMDFGAFWSVLLMVWSSVDTSTPGSRLKVVGAWCFSVAKKDADVSLCQY